MDKLERESVNACWKNEWNEVVNDFKGFLGIDGEVRKFIHRTRQVDGEGYSDMLDEVEEHIEGHRQVSKNEELEELIESSTEGEEDKEETEAEPPM